MIEDDGPGLPSELLGGAGPRCFFTTKRLGTGLGLVTTQALAKASRGELRFENGPTGGARVELRMPWAPAPSTSTAA